MRSLAAIDHDIVKAKRSLFDLQVERSAAVKEEAIERHAWRRVRDAKIIAELTERMRKPDQRRTAIFQELALELDTSYHTVCTVWYAHQHRMSAERLRAVAERHAPSARVVK